MTAPTTGPQPTPPAGGTPSGQDTQPTGTTPPNPATPGGPTPSGPAPAGSGPVTSPDPVGQQPQGTEKTFTQADLDRILTDRMDRFEKSFGEKFAGQLLAALGGKPADGDGKQTPDQVLAQAQQFVEQAQTRANTATARSFAATSVKDDRIDTLVGMVDVNAALANVDANDPAAVNAALRAAVEAKAAEFPEWARDAAPQLPGSSTANPHQPQGNGRKVWTRAEIEAMSQRELAANANELIAAQREGRIK